MISFFVSALTMFAGLCLILLLGRKRLSRVERWFLRRSLRLGQKAIALYGTTDRSVVSLKTFGHVRDIRRNLRRIRERLNVLDAQFGPS